MVKQLLFKTLLGEFNIEGSKVVKSKNTSNLQPVTPEEISSCLRATSKLMKPHDLRQKNLELTRNQIRKSFSRDILIVHVISTLEELDKVINSMLGKLSQWYHVENPETALSLRGTLRLAEVMCTDRQISSMGVELSPVDSDVLTGYAKCVSEVGKEKEKLLLYLERLLEEIAPHLLALAGPTIAARLIQHAGSLKRLASLPSSTLQMLGAEKALFRHLTTGAKPPKYGVISQHPFFMKAKKHQHGKIARLLADKIMIGVRIDYFKGECRIKELQDEIDEKLEKILSAGR